ncbi:lymphocyte antigen 75-like [Brachyistius frenatus]
MSWFEAQEYCRKYHTDLSPLSTKLEKDVFTNSEIGNKIGWIGLYWVGDGWRWSGGDNATYTFWHNQKLFYTHVLWYTNGWYKNPPSNRLNFFCLNLVVVEEEKSWEEALEHCRENHKDFTSLLSKTETLLALTEIQHQRITDRVWIGLRFLVDSWIWVNGDPLEYEGWSQEGHQDQQCPVWNRCGALTKEGLWENRDCRERLNFICV